MVWVSFLLDQWSIQPGWIGLQDAVFTLAVSSITVPSLVIGILSGLLILIAAVVADRLLLGLLKRLRVWLERFLSAKQKSWFDLAYSAVQFLLRVGLWTAAIVGVFTQIPPLQPLAHQIRNGVIALPMRLLQLADMTLFELDRNPVSLSTLLGLIVATIFVFLAARLFSQWLKRRILGRAQVDIGTQEAIAAIISYTLTIIGFLILLQAQGLDLSSLAVLAGVVAFGLGLGLQELASHFISGLTLLFEQQVRVGDFVEVDGLLGTIERISIRSTVVRTQDRRFVIVPNKHFFGNNVINWSYQTPESRIHIPVGVAYGSDTVLVTETLLAAARMEPRVLSYPPPRVWFKNFGDSAYEFELLVWINQPQEFEPISSALNFLIEQELSRRGIEIPFPQRDLWLRNPETLPGAISVGQTHQVTPKVAGAGTDGKATEKPTKKAIPNNRTLRELLRKVSYFEQCTNAQLRVLIEQGYRKSLAANQIICRENEPGESFYMILAGKVEVVSERLNQVIATLEEGEFFGEISLLTGTPRTATVRTQQDTTLFVVDRRALQKLLQDHRSLADQIAQALCQRQQVLRELGVLNRDELGKNEDAPFIWVRRRIQTLFGI